MTDSHLLRLARIVEDIAGTACFNTQYEADARDLIAELEREDATRLRLMDAQSRPAAAPPRHERGESGGEGLPAPAAPDTRRWWVATALDGTPVAVIDHEPNAREWRNIWQNVEPVVPASALAACERERDEAMAGLNRWIDELSSDKNTICVRVEEAEKERDEWCAQAGFDSGAANDLAKHNAELRARIAELEARDPCDETSLGIVADMLTEWAVAVREFALDRTTASEQRCDTARSRVDAGLEGLVQSRAWWRKLAEKHEAQHAAVSATLDEVQREPSPVERLRLLESLRLSSVRVHELERERDKLLHEVATAVYRVAELEKARVVTREQLADAGAALKSVVFGKGTTVAWNEIAKIIATDLGLTVEGA